MKRIICTAIFSLAIFTSTAQQTQSLMDRYFPAPENFTFTSPTLSLGDGGRFATREEIKAWIEGRIASDARLSGSVIGTTTGGVEVPLLHLGTPGRNKVKVWFQGAIHGNEPGGAEGLFQLVDWILSSDEGAALLRNVDLYILPIANPDGYLACTRVSADGYDLNRDQTKFADPQSAVIKKAFIGVNPDLAVDFHEYNPFLVEPSLSAGSAKGWSMYYDVLFLPTGYLNVPEQLRSASAKFIRTPAEKALDDLGLRHSTYFTMEVKDGEPSLVLSAKSPRSSSTSYALSGAISMLVEFRGISLGRQCLERRTLSSFTVARTILEQADANCREIKDIVRSARRSTIKGRRDVTVIADSKLVRVPQQFINLDDEQLVTVDNIRGEEAAMCEPVLVRERPKAYIIEPGNDKAVSNLRTLGLDVKELRRPRKFKVESFEVLGCTDSPKLWEKITRRSVTTRTVRGKVRFPAGSFLVRLNQENADFAVSVLEPEGDNGFVYFRVLDAEPGCTLKVHRVI